ncbi:MAG: hypothetical protein U0230_24160 [Polyangiales bacterium]
MTEREILRMLDLYEDGLYTPMELPFVAVRILDASPDPAECWRAMPLSLRAAVRQVASRADREDLVVLHEADATNAVLQLRRVRQLLNERGWLAEE